MPFRSRSELLNMFMIPERSSVDMLRLESNVDMSNFSVSKLLIAPDSSRLSSSRVNNFNIDLTGVMSKSELFMTSMISDTLIADKS